MNPQSRASLRQDRRIVGITPGSFRQTIGNNTSTAITQRQKCYYRKRNYPISYKLRKLTLKLDQLMQAGQCCGLATTFSGYRYKS
ncbi:MAG: hypothetical protein O6944_02525 [Gammaproteobacteria bacterium]|nr:hypothetical protein [Gammaproteobacteria bacterium]